MTPATSTAETSPIDSSRRTRAFLRLCGVNPADVGALADRPIEDIHDTFDAWAASLDSIGPDEHLPHSTARAKARTLLARAPARWPAHFLQFPPPPEVAPAVQAVVLQPARPLWQTSMAPQPIDLGPVSEVADGTWRTFDTWPVLRGLTTWMLFALLLGAVFYVVRF